MASFATIFLGRIVSQETPQGVTTFVYDGASSRLLSSTFGSSNTVIATAPIYDVYGDLIGTARNGIATTQVVSYETISNELWRVTTQATAAEGQTNRLIVTKEQITGLSDALTSRIVSFVNGAKTASSEISFNRETLEQTESAWSATSGIVVRKSKFGRVTRTETADGANFSFYDPYGRVYHTEHGDLGAIAGLQSVWIGYDNIGDVAEKCVFSGAGTSYVPEFFAYDVFGNRLATTNVYGHVETAQYDAVNRVTEVGGTTYPVRYDTAGHQTSLATTCDGMNWDETRRTYDAATGFNTSKIYADGSTVSYAYTADGKQGKRIKNPRVTSLSELWYAKCHGYRKHRLVRAF